MGNGKPSEEDYVLLRSNRRKNLRKQLLVLKVKGEGERGVFFGYAKTIGRGGMFISSVNPRKVGEEFRVTFTPPGVDRDVTCTCVVVWQRGYDPTLKFEPGMGVKFLDLDEDIRDKIEEWIQKQD